MKRGFILFEVILATMIFAVAATGMAIALQSALEGAIASRWEASVRMRMDSKLALIRQQPLDADRLKEEKDPRGVTYDATVEKLPLRDMKNFELQGIFKITVRARWTQGKLQEERTSELWVYQP